MSVDCIAVLGDSASTGFGTHGRAYGALLGEALGASRVENLSAFSRTARLMLDEDAARLGDLRPDLVIVQAGMADSLPHPGERLQRQIERFAPRSWHGVDGLERRAIFSGSTRRRAQQRLVATAKTTLKRTVIGLTGGYTRMEPADFGLCLDQLFTRLEHTTDLIVSVGLYDIDQRFFPKQHASSVRFRQERSAVLVRHPRVVPVEVGSSLHQWDHYLGDHAHWNVEGHEAVAGEILRTLGALRPEGDRRGRTALRKMQ